MRLTNYSQPTPLVSQAFADLKPESVLDIGSHEGRNALYLARLGWKVVAIDTDQEVLTHLQKTADNENLSIDTIVTDVCEYAPNTSFDAVLALMVLHFLPKKEIDSVIEKMQKWTNKGGVNIVTAFTTKNPIGTRPYLFPANSLKDRYSGWKIKSYEESYTSWVIPEGKVDAERYMAARLVAKK